MDGLTFHKVIQIAGREFTGATLNRISVMDSQLYLTFYLNSTFVLRFKSNPPPALEMVSVAAGENLSVFGTLNGAKLTGVGGRSYDRVGYLDFEKRRPSGKLIAYRLVFEPMGNYANAFLLNEKGVILYRLTSKSIDPDRDIGVGKTYTEPRQNKRYNLDTLGECSSFADLLGFYPVTSTAAEKYTSLYGFEAAVEMIKKELDTGETFYKNANGKILPFEDPGNQSEGIPFNELSFTKESAQDKGSAELITRLKKFYTKEFNHYKKLCAKLEKELETAGKWMDLRDEAELVKMNFGIIKGPGDYELTHYSGDSVETVKYRYGSMEPLNKYVDKLYKRSGKLARSIPHIQARLAEVEQLMRSASEQLYYVESAEARELKELVELLKKRPAVNINRSRSDQKEFYEYTFEGARIYIGRNSTSNHRLVFGFANASDIWLHAHNIPSAHGIIRSDSSVSDEVIMYTARLVAAYSRNKNEKRVPVDYALKKYVKKPKNTPLGFVTYTNYKTLDTEPFSTDDLAIDQNQE